MLTGKVSPKYKGKVFIFKQQGKKWKKFKTLRTSSKEQVQHAAAAPRGAADLLPDRDPGSKAFTKTKSGKFYTYSS